MHLRVVTPYKLISHEYANIRKLYFIIPCNIYFFHIFRVEIMSVCIFEIFQYFMVKVSLFHETLREEGETSIYAGAQKSDQVRQLDHKISLKNLLKPYIV